MTMVFWGYAYVYVSFFPWQVILGFVKTEDVHFTLWPFNDECLKLGNFMGNHGIFRPHALQSLHVFPSIRLSGAFMLN